MRRRINILLPIAVLLIAATTAYNEKVWDSTNTLEWKDFNTQPSEAYYDALTATAISFSYTTKATTFDIEVFAVFDKDESWVNSHKASEALLSHEQLHFDITELWTRRLRRAISDARYLDEEILAELYDAHLKGMARMQQYYDAETHHSLRHKPQRNWSTRVRAELNKLSDYQSSLIVKPREVVAQQ